MSNLNKKQLKIIYQLMIILALVLSIRASAAAQEPTTQPTQEPTAAPTQAASATATKEATATPETSATQEATATSEATAQPTQEATQEATAEPTSALTAEPTPTSTAEPTQEATAEATSEPTAESTPEPTVEPTQEATAEATQEPTFTVTTLDPVSVEQGSKEASEALRQAAPGSQGNPVSIIVQLEDASLAAYEGGLPGLAPTSPEVTGAQKVDVNAPESQLYLGYLLQQQSTFENNLNKRTSGARIVHRYQVVLNGFSMVVNESQAASIARLPGVKAVYRDELRHLDTERSPYFISAPRIWKQLGGQDSAGQGVIVGILDSGIWPEHPSFADPDPSGDAFPEPPGKWAGTACEFGSSIAGDVPFTCNNKLIGAQRFMETYEQFGPPLLPGEFLSARDDDGHGSHTASTAAGNGKVKAQIFGIPRGTISGIAPRAHVVAYKVCGNEGCYESDSIAAIQQAIIDGVDVLNFSIGGGANPYADPVELAFLDAYAAGIFVAASAGNDGPDPDTVEHRGPWVTSVAASRTDRFFQSKVVLVASNGDKLRLTGVSITDGIKNSTAVVNAANFGDALCQNGTPDGAFTGQIVVCQGATGRLQKSFNVKQRGAVGMLLYNPVLASVSSDNHYVPSIHLQNDAGERLLNFLATHSGVTATFPRGRPDKVQGDVLAAFSSRGGPEQSLGVSKPDVTAPGVQILAGNTPLGASVFSGPPGELFQAIQGTSMSSPHVAGAAALLKDLHPKWSPGQIKSALMATAKTIRQFKEDGETPADAFDVGSGRIDLRHAGDPGLTFDVSAKQYLDNEEDLWNVNYPSLYIPVMPGQITVQRTAKSLLDAPTEWRVSAKTDDDWYIIIPENLRLGAREKARFDITIDARNVPLGEVRYGEIRLTAGSRKLHLPVTIVRGQPLLTMEKECKPRIFREGEKTDCTITLRNTSFENARADLVDNLPEALKLVESSVQGAEIKDNGIRFSGVIAGAVPPLVSVVPGTSPGGYLPLSGFGVPAVSGMGDETIANFTVAPFLFAGETYTRIGVVSNGYAVVGGGSGAEVSFVNQLFPDPTPPNNVLAPFWTDLNLGAGGAMRVAVLTNGTQNWLVLDWETAPNFSDGETNSFQIWIGQNGVEDISFTYGPNLSDGDLGFLTVGAENSFGNAGSSFYVNGEGTLPTPATQLVVVSTAGAPGQTQVITFQARGIQRTRWQNCARLTSNIFQGINISCASGRVE